MAHEDVFPWQDSLRVLLVHSRYSSQQSSGENTAVDRHAEVMSRDGIAVRVVEQRTDDLERSRAYALTTAASVASGVGRSPLQAIRDFQPDVVHVHNLFPNFGSRWLNKVEVPVVATLHNYRPMCPAGAFFRDNRPCTDCLDRRSTWPSVLHGCYRGSRVATLPVAAGRHFAEHPVLRRADRLIVLQGLMADLYRQSGVAPEKMTVVPNFGPDLGLGLGDGQYFLYVGRLSEEKGIRRLVSEWPQGHRLLVVGEGPQREAVESAAGPDVEVVGALPAEKVAELMQAATGLVVPSRCFEGFPLVYAEALSAGTPVLAWEANAVASLVDADGTGLRVTGPLPEVLDEASATFPRMRRGCRSVYEEKYTERSWLAQVRGIYEEVMRRRPTAHQRPV